MKKLFTILLFSLAISRAFAQLNPPLTIPGGCSFTNYGDHSNGGIPSAYNCHAWAFYLDDMQGGQPWPISINAQGSDGAPQIYWNSGLYAEISDSSQATHVVYGGSSGEGYSPAHSAKRNGTFPNGVFKYRSKWEENSPGLTDHSIQGYQYYAGSYIHYYKKNEIVGSGSMCPNSTQTYSLLGLPSGATVTWTCSGNVSCSSSSATVSVTSNGNINYTGHVSATIHSACSGGSISLDKTVAIISPPTITGPALICTNNTQPFSLNGLPSGEAVTWTTSPANLVIASGQNTNSAVLQAGSGAGARGTVTATIGGCTSSAHPWVGVPEAISSVSASSYSAGPGSWGQIQATPDSQNFFYGQPFDNLFNQPTGIDPHGAEIYSWTCNVSPFYLNASTAYSRYSAITFNFTGSCQVTLQAMNGCGLVNYVQSVNVTY